MVRVVTFMHGGDESRVLLGLFWMQGVGVHRGCEGNAKQQQDGIHDCDGAQSEEVDSV